MPLVRTIDPNTYGSSSLYILTMGGHLSVAAIVDFDAIMALLSSDRDLGKLFFFKYQIIKGFIFFINRSAIIVVLKVSQRGPKEKQQGLTFLCFSTML